MMSHNRISENRFIAEKCPFCLEPSDQLDSITSRMGTDSQGGPSCFSLARFQFIFQKITQNGRLSPNHPAEGANFLSEMLSTTLRLVQPWFDSVEIILSSVTNSKWFIHSSSLGPTIKSRFVLFPWIDHWIHISDIKSNHAAFWD